MNHSPNICLTLVQIWFFEAYNCLISIRSVCFYKTFTIKYVFCIDSHAKNKYRYVHYYKDLYSVYSIHFYNSWKL